MIVSAPPLKLISSADTVRLAIDIVLATAAVAVPAVRVRSLPTPETAPFKVMLASFEVMVVAFKTLRIPVMVNPSNPLQLRPSIVTAPANELAVSPLANVTSSLNRVEPPALEDTIPLLPATVSLKVTKPVEASVMAAPTPSPIALIAPENVVVPAAVPAAIVRS